VISAIVLAAGESTRFGHCKQLQLIGEKPMLEHTLDHVRLSRASEIIVVLGASAQEIQKQIRLEPERVIFNPHFAEGMSSSIQAGLRAASGHAALVVHADQPFVKPETMDRLIDEYERVRPKIVMPMYNGSRGNPVLVDRALFAEMMSLRGDIGFRAIFEKHAASIAQVAVDDPGVIRDVDKPSDLR